METVEGRPEGYSLTQNAGFVGIAKFANIIGLLAVSMILTRMLTRSEYGNYEQTWLVYNSFLPLIGYGFSSAIYFFSAREEKRLVYSAAVLDATIIGFVTGVALVILAPAVAQWFNAPRLAGYFRIIAVYAVVSSPAMMFESVFVTERRVGLLLAGNASLAVLFAAAVLMSALLFHSLTIVFYVIVFIGLAKSGYLLFFLTHSKKLASRRLSPAMKAQLLYALPIVVSSITGTISKQVDRYLVSMFFSPDQFALYAIGSKEVPMIGVITGSAAAVLFPVFSEFGSKEMKGKFVEIWRNSMSKTGLFLLPIMVFLLFTAKDFMHFFFGQKYVASAGVFRIFLLLFPMRLAFYSQALLSLGKQKLYMYSSFGEMVLSGVASYFLLRTYGLEGAATGKVIVSYIEVIFIVVVLMVLLKTNVAEFFPWGKIAKIISMSALCIVPLIFIRSIMVNIYMRFIVEFGAFAVLFAVLALATGSVRIVNLRKLQFIVN